MAGPPAMRPSFEAQLPEPQPEVLARARARLEECEPRVHAVIADKHLELLVDVEQRHYWSPWLSVTVEPHEAGAKVHGRFGPHPSVWTMFMSIHVFLVMGGCTAAVYGYTLWTLGHSPWPALALPVALVLMALTYLIAIVGQRYGKDQMWLLHTALDDMLGHDTRHAAYENHDAADH